MPGVCHNFNKITWAFLPLILQEVSPFSTYSMFCLKKIVKYYFHQEPDSLNMAAPSCPVWLFPFLHTAKIHFTSQSGCHQLLPFCFDKCFLYIAQSLLCRPQFPLIILCFYFSLCFVLLPLSIAGTTLNTHSFSSLLKILITYFHALLFSCYCIKFYL